MSKSSLLCQLYVELYDPKLLPHDLLENLNLKNYISVNFSKMNDLTLGKTKCYLENGMIVEYIYTFNDDKLIRLEAVNEGKQSEIIYDRQVEIDKLRSELEIKMKLPIVS